VLQLMMAAIVPALADVTVEDSSEPRCLEVEDLDLEVRQVLGDEVVDQISLSARLYGVDGWQLSLVVYDGGELLWQREMSVEPVDCPFLPALIARSVERGLSSLIDDLQSAREHVELGLLGSVTLPTAARLSGGPSLWLPIHSRLHLQFDLEGYGSFVEPVSEGGWQLAGAWGGFGPGIETGSGSDELRASVRGVLGPAVVIGRGFVDNNEKVRTRAAILADVGFASRHGIRVLLRAEVPLKRVVPTQRGRPGTPEPPFRLGLCVGYGGSIGSTEGPTNDRP
jgi:hypothetical protein